MNPVLIFAIVAVVVIIAAAIYLLRPRQQEEPRVEGNPETAWDHYVAHPEKWSTRDRKSIESLRTGGSDMAEPIKQAVAETWERVQAAPNPQAALRQSIMDATDGFLLTETLQEASESPELLPGVVEAGVLRCLSMLRFDDFAPDDWYKYYVTMAEMNTRNVAGMVRKTVSGEQSGMEASLHDPLISAMREVRTALLHYPPRKPVHRSDKLIKRDVPTQPYPSQEQIDQLTEIMSERFEKLFSGLVYQSAGGPVEPAAAFQVDAGLLYALLATNFRHPEEGWRKIMDKSLGSFRDAMRNEDKLLQIGVESHRLWVENEEAGPLSPVLSASCRMAFEGESGGAEALAARMSEDARILVGAVLKVVAPSPTGWKA